MIGHSFLHDGPCVAGISPAILHVLFGGTPETATIVLEDCSDVDVRTTIQLVCFSLVLSAIYKTQLFRSDICTYKCLHTMTQTVLKSQNHLTHAHLVHFDLMLPYRRTDCMN